MTDRDRDAAIAALAQGYGEAVQEMRGLRVDLRDIDAKRGRELNIFKGAIALVAVAVVVTTFVALTNRPILNLIKSTVTPGGEIYQRSQTSTASLVQGLAGEIDCRNRRAAAGLGPPTVAAVPGPDGGLVVRQTVACGDMPDSPPGFATVRVPPPAPVHVPNQDPNWEWLVPALVLPLLLATVIVWRRNRNPMEEPNQ